MKRSWSRIGIWETRVFEDLKAFCTSDDDFRYIRKAIAALVASNSLTSGGNDKAGISSTATVDATSSSSRSKSHQDGKTAAAPSCVPFIGKQQSYFLCFRISDSGLISNSNFSFETRCIFVSTVQIQPTSRSD